MSMSYSQKLASALLQISGPAAEHLPRACIYVAGGGSGAISTLAATPGASAVLLEGLLAYDRRSFLNCVKSTSYASSSVVWSSDKSFCSKEAALALSSAALKRSLDLTPRMSQREKCVGVGCTSALVSSVPKKGDHRCFVALSNIDGTSNVYSLILSKGVGRSRSSEDEVVSSIVLNALLHRWMDSSRDTTTSELETTLDRTIAEVIDAMLSNNENIVLEDVVLDETVSSVVETANRVVNGNDSLAVLTPSQSLKSSHCELSPTYLASLPPNPIIFPGSFNPPHVGHLKLAKAAIAAVNRRYVKMGTNAEDYPINILFELSITNPDKPPIPSEMVAKRITGFTSIENRAHLPTDWGIILSSAPLFAQKVDLFSKLLPDSDDPSDTRMTFVIGTDTMVRIIDPKYYGNSESNMLDAVRGMKEQKVHFVVGGRLEQKAPSSGEARFIDGQKELELLPKCLQEMFTVLGKDEFRVDISSSQIRAVEAAKIL